MTGRNRPDQLLEHLQLFLSLSLSLSRTLYSIAIDTIIMSLNEVWEAASASPFHPLIPKSSQATFGFNCLLIGTRASPISQDLH